MNSAKTLLIKNYKNKKHLNNPTRKNTRCKINSIYRSNQPSNSQTASLSKALPSLPNISVKKLVATTSEGIPMIKINNSTAQADSSLRRTGEQIEKDFTDLLLHSSALTVLIETSGWKKNFEQIGCSAKTILVSPEEICIDERLDIRNGIDQEMVETFAEAIKQGDELPPIDVVNLTGKQFVVNGLATLEAARMVGVKQIKARVLDCPLDIALGIKIHKSSLTRQDWKPSQKKPFVIALLKLMQKQGDKIIGRQIARLFRIDNHYITRYLREIENDSIRYDDRITGDEIDSAKAIIREGDPNGEIPHLDIGCDSGYESSPDFNQNLGNDIEDDGKPQAEGDQADNGKPKTKQPKKKRIFPPKAIELHRNRYPVEFGDCYRIISPKGFCHYLFCNDISDRKVLQIFYGLYLIALVLTDPPYGTEVAGSGHTYGTDTGNFFFANIHLRGAQLELLLMNAFNHIAQCLKKGAVYNVFVGFYERDMFKKVCQQMFGKPHIPLIWRKKNYVRSMHCITSWDTEECLLGWTRGGKKPARTEGKGNSFLGCAYRQDEVYARGEFVENSEYDIGCDYHPCSKPVLLLKEFIERYSSPKQAVMDCFAGSGSTAVACELSTREIN